MVKVKIYDDESADSLIKRFKRVSFLKIKKFKEKEYFITPVKLKERKRREKNKTLKKFKRFN